MVLLVEIPKNKWINLRDLYKAMWPEGAVAYCLLDTQITNLNFSDIINFKVYCPEGDITNGMIATGDLFGYYQLFIHPLNDIKKIEEALQNTNVIDWRRDICVPSANSKVKECIQKLQNSRGIYIKYTTVTYKHVLDDNTESYDVSVCPLGSYVGPLKPEHITLIDQTWTYRGETTAKLFEILMKHDMTYVLYSSKDDKPMAWITVNLEGALTHLYTLEPYRRLGYGEFITKYAACDLKKKGKCVLAYTVDSNQKPRQMFNKLGFRIIGVDEWIFVSLKSNTCLRS